MESRNFKNAAVLAALLSVSSSCAASQQSTVAPSLPMTSAPVATAPAAGTTVAKAVHILEPPKPLAGQDVAASSTKVAPSDASKQDPPAAPMLVPERRAIEALDRVSPFVPFRREKRGVVFTLATDDLFEPGAAKLSTTASTKLDELATALRLQGEKAIEIDGFTDSLGDPVENEYLSSRRADALRAYFSEKGVDPAKTRAAGLGAKRPVADNDTPFGRSQNRRIEIVIGAAPSVGANGSTAAATARSTTRATSS